MPSVRGTEEELDIERERSYTQGKIFPKKLPDLKVGPIIDETGLTLTEKVALRQAFRLIKRHDRRFAKDIFYTFLTTNEAVIEIFRMKSPPNLNISALHGHALAIMRFIAGLVNEGLQDTTIFNMMFNDNIVIHAVRDIPLMYIHPLIEALKEYVLDVMSNAYSESLRRGFQKIADKFISEKTSLIETKVSFYQTSEIFSYSRSRIQLAGSSTNI